MLPWLEVREIESPQTRHPAAFRANAAQIHLTADDVAEIVSNHRRLTGDTSESWRVELQHASYGRIHPRWIDTTLHAVKQLAVLKSVSQFRYTGNYVSVIPKDSSSWCDFYDLQLLDLIRLIHQCPRLRNSGEWLSIVVNPTASVLLRTPADKRLSDLIGTVLREQAVYTPNPLRMLVLNDPWAEACRTQRAAMTFKPNFTGLVQIAAGHWSNPKFAGRPWEVDKPWSTTESAEEKRKREKAEDKALRARGCDADCVQDFIKPTRIKDNEELGFQTQQFDSRLGIRSYARKQGHRGNQFQVQVIIKNKKRERVVSLEEKYIALIDGNKRIADRAPLLVIPHSTEHICPKCNEQHFIGTFESESGGEPLSQVRTIKSVLCIRQADLELFKTTGRVKWGMKPFKSADFYTMGSYFAPNLTLEQEDLLYNANRIIDLDRYFRHKNDVQRGISEYEDVRNEALAAAIQQPGFNQWQIDRIKWAMDKKTTLRPYAPDEFCLWLLQVEALRPWWTQPGHSIIWQDKFGNLSGSVTQPADKQWFQQRPKKVAPEAVPALEHTEAKGQPVDPIVYRWLLGEMSATDAAKLKGMSRQDLKNQITQTLFLLVRDKYESSGDGAKKFIQQAVRNAYGSEQPKGWHIICRLRQSKPWAYSLHITGAPTDEELGDALLCAARREAYRMFWDKTEKKGYKALGIGRQTRNDDEKVLAIRKEILDGVIKSFNKGLRVDLTGFTPTSTQISLLRRGH